MQYAFSFSNCMKMFFIMQQSKAELCGIRNVCTYLLIYTVVFINMQIHNIYYESKSAHVYVRDYCTVLYIYTHLQFIIFAKHITFTLYEMHNRNKAYFFNYVLKEHYFSDDMQTSYLKIQNFTQISRLSYQHVLRGMLFMLYKQFFSSNRM